MHFDQLSYPTLGLVSTERVTVFSAVILLRVHMLALCIVCTQRVVTIISAHENPVVCAAFNHHGNLLATASDKVCSAYVARRIYIDVY